MSVGKFVFVFFMGGFVYVRYGVDIMFVIVGFIEGVVVVVMRRGWNVIMYVVVDGFVNVIVWGIVVVVEVIVIVIFGVFEVMV